MHPLLTKCADQVYDVFISKAYFPAAVPGKPGKEDFEQWKVKANSRQEAAERVWAEHGARLLSLMTSFEGRLPRKVSLFVSDPRRKTAPGRLQPILVYQESKTAADGDVQVQDKDWENQVKTAAQSEDAPREQHTDHQQDNISKTDPQHPFVEEKTAFIKGERWAYHPNYGTFSTPAQVPHTDLIEKKMDRSMAIGKNYDEVDKGYAFIDKPQKSVLLRPGLYQSTYAEGRPRSGGVDPAVVEFYQKRFPRFGISVVASKTEHSASDKEAKTGPHKNAVVQANLPSSAAAKIFELAKQIPDEELGPDGREDDAHITIKFGVKDDLEALRLLL
jgi:hypothetical protein